MSNQSDQNPGLGNTNVETNPKIKDIGAFSREGSVASNASTSSSDKNSSKEACFQPIDDSEDGPNPGQRGHRPQSGGRPKATTHDSPTIQFYSGNPMVERTCGILHLYKDK